MGDYTKNFVAGAYKVTFGSQVMGYTEAGFEMIMRPSANIIRLDPTGRTPLEAILTGVEDIVVRLESMEWTQNIWTNGVIPFLVKTAVEGKSPAAGTLLCAGGLAQSLVLTNMTNTTTGANYGFKYAYPLEPVRSVLSAQRLRTSPAGFFIFARSFDDTTFIPTLYTETHDGSAPSVA